ncbi:MAG: M20/M25/M40 family metallo-hydrolase [Anaerolineales bacterium]|jgi:tripeptide aminopeptidase
MDIERLVSNTIHLQGIPAPTFDEGPRADALQTFLEVIPRIGIERDACGNLLARLEGNPGAPVIISAHLDSVFDQSTPLASRREPGRIFGPGIGDNALGVACLVELAHDFGRQSLPGDIWLVANVAEEGLGNLAGMREIVSRFGDLPSAYFVIEGMAFGHIYHRGLPIRRYRVVIEGQGGHAWVHAGRPAAIHALLRLGSRIERMRLPKKPKTTINIGSIQGGSSINTISARAQLELEVRSESPLVLERIDRTLHKICTTQEPHEPLTVKIELIGVRPAGELPADHPLVQLAWETTRAHTDIEPRLEMASTDASLPLSKGYPAICLGITYGGNAHSQEEFIETGMIEQGYTVLKEIVRTWMDQTANKTGRPGT